MCSATDVCLTFFLFILLLYFYYVDVCLTLFSSVLSTLLSLSDCCVLHTSRLLCSSLCSVIVVLYSSLLHHFSLSQLVHVVYYSFHVPQFSFLDLQYTTLQEGYDLVIISPLK